MDRWSQWQSEVQADLEILKATLKTGADAVQRKFQAVDDGLESLRANLNELREETAKQDVAVLKALGRIGKRFNEVAEGFRGQEARLGALEQWRAEVEHKLAS